jgi:hypothetical protein
MIPGQYITYLIDGYDTITYVSPEWVAFCGENGVRVLTPAAVLGKSIFDFIADGETRELFRMVYGRLRSKASPLVLPFRCDSPNLRRYMEMRLTLLLDNHIEHQSHLLRLEPRQPVLCWDATLERSETFVKACSWCKRLQTAQGWVEVEEAIRVNELFNHLPLPQITHGICPTCAQAFHAYLTSAKGEALPDAPA